MKSLTKDICPLSHTNLTPADSVFTVTAGSRYCNVSLTGAASTAAPHILMDDPEMRSRDVSISGSSKAHSTVFDSLS